MRPKKNILIVSDDKVSLSVAIFSINLSVKVRATGAEGATEASRLIGTRDWSAVILLSPLRSYDKVLKESKSLAPFSRTIAVSRTADDFDGCPLVDLRVHNPTTAEFLELIRIAAKRKRGPRVLYEKRESVTTLVAQA